jgi:hypothetical protein
MNKTWIFLLLIAGASTSALGQEVTWRSEIGPMVSAKCGACHGASAPEYNDWMLLGDEKRKTVAPRLDTYPTFMSHVIWPGTGAVMRRLDDGKAAGGKPGNMYQNLGSNDEERAKNLKQVKDWIGASAWNLNRWNASGDVPGITKAQMEKIKAKY